MPTEVLISTILITLALIFYTIGVWAERLAGRLMPWHLIFFWGGLIFDTTGTSIMMDMAGGLTFDILHAFDDDANNRIFLGSELFYDHKTSIMKVPVLPRLVPPELTARQR